MPEFSSVFAPYIIRLLADWKSAGHKVWDLKRSFRSFDSFCIKNGCAGAVLTRGIVCAWISAGVQENKGICSNASAIRKLVRYMIGIGIPSYILPNGYMVPYTPRRRHDAVHMFTDSELEAFFNAAGSISPKKQADPWVTMVAPVIFRLQYLCGLRPNEVREIKCSDINLEAGEILIRHNKELKQRIVVMADDVLGMCRKYAEQKKAFAPDSVYFFPRQKGQMYTGKLYNALFQRCWRKSFGSTPENEIPHARPYDFRHRFASTVLIKWINEGRDLYAMLPYLRAYMGHEQLSHTAYYIHVIPESILRSKGISWEKMDHICPEVSVWQ